MWRELRTSHADELEATEALSNSDLNRDGTVAGKAPRKTLGQAALQIVIADVSMSLDNVLAVAGAARDHFPVLIIGLVLSIALMGLAASFIARLLHRHRWIAYIGLAHHPLRRARHDLSRRLGSLAAREQRGELTRPVQPLRDLDECVSTASAMRFAAIPG